MISIGLGSTPRTDGTGLRSRSTIAGKVVQFPYFSRGEGLESERADAWLDEFVPKGQTRPIRGAAGPSDLVCFLSNRGQFSFDPFTKLDVGEANMSLSKKVGPLLAARAATDPDAAKLLEMFKKAEKMLNESSILQIGDEMPTIFSASDVRRQSGHNGY